MKIATYNVNGIRARLPVLVQWLQQTTPDVVCLQELKTPQESFPEEDIKTAGYNSVWQGQKSWNGVAVLCRHTTPQIVQQGLPGNEADEQSRYLQVTIENITIACLYLPNGNPAPGPKFDYKLQWVEHFTTHAASLANNKNSVILCGDYNIIPTEKDVYKPERWTEDALFRPESREAFKTLLAQGWTDALRHLNPDKTIYTYWDYFRQAFKRNAGLRIDHFLLNSAATQKLQVAGVDTMVRGWDKSSDHAPVWIEVQD